MEALTRSGLVETVDLDKLKFIAENVEFFLDGKPKVERDMWRERCMKYHKFITDGRKVKYFQVDGRGRYFARKALSLQSFPRCIRGTISDEFYYDFDIVNCHPKILLSIFATHDIARSNLEKYIRNRDAVIDALAKKNPAMNKEDIKELLLKILNNGEYYYKQVKHKNAWLKAYFTEITSGLRALTKIYVSEYNDAVEHCRDSDKPNVLGRFISCLLCEKENELLGRIVEYFISTNVIRDDAVLCFDGIMVRKDHITVPDGETPDQVLATHVSNIEAMLASTGDHFNLKVKPMATYNLSNPEGIIQYCKNKLESELECSILDGKINENAIVDGSMDDKRAYRSTYRESEYYWYDFVNEVCRTKELDINGLAQLFKRNVNKVMFKCFKGNKYIIKMSPDDMFYMSAKTPEENLYYYSINPTTGQILEHTSLLSQLISTKGWREHIHFYNDMTFDPSGSDNDFLFNTWTGFKAKLLDLETTRANESALEPIFDLLRMVWCGGDESLFKYVISWFHFAFKYPNLKNKVAIILYSKLQQVGKGIFINEFLIPHVYGKKLSMSVSGLQSVVDNFNSHLMNKLFINCDELQTLTGDFHGTFDALKKIVTDPTMTINIKYQEPMVNYPNYVNIICSTNNVDSFKMEEGDSRYCVLECSAVYRGNQQYFKDLINNVFNEDMGDLFYSYCYHFEEPVCLKNIPMTKLRRDMVMNSLGSTRRFIYVLAEYIDEYGLGVGNDDDVDEYDEAWVGDALENVRIRPGQLYECYKAYCGTANEKAKSSAKFGRDIRDMVDCVTVRGRKYYKLDTIKRL